MSIANLRFTFSCQRCGSVLEAVGQHCGQVGRCPTCGAVFVIPPVDPQTGLATGPARVTDDGQLPTPMHAYGTAGAKAPTIRRLGSGEQVIVCPRCGRNGPVDSNLCGGCGLPFTIEGAAAAAAVPGGNEGNPWSAAALTVGVLSVPSFCFPLPAVAAIGLGIVALRKGRMQGPAASKRGMAIAGIVCGILSLAVFAAWTAGDKLF
jgi:hypothetical protein